MQKADYQFSQYACKERWLSYWEQINETLKCGAKNVLIIGVGDGLLPLILNQLCGIKVTTFDYDPNLKPDIVGDIRHIDQLITESYDCIICCQVLEHIKWCYFGEVLKKISDLSPKTFILSIPSEYQKFELKFQFKNKIYRYKKMLFHLLKPKYSYNGMHYWEMGTQGCTKHDVNKIIRQYFYINRTYFVDEFEYHCFYILKPRKKR